MAPLRFLDRLCKLHRMTDTKLPSAPKTGWKHGAAEITRRMAAERASAAQIAAVVNKSRSAVIGFCHRNRIQLMGGASRSLTKPKKEKPMQIARMSHRTAAPPMPLALMAPVDLGSIFDGTGRKSLSDSTKNDCLWPLGEPASLRICGDTVHKKGFCEKHFRLAYK